MIPAKKTYWFGWTFKSFNIKDEDYVWYEIKYNSKPSISFCMEIIGFKPEHTVNKMLVVRDTKPSNLDELTPILRCYAY